MCKNTKIWMKAAIMRAIRTIAQTFVATVGTAAVMSEVNWKVVISATVLAGFFSYKFNRIAWMRRKRKILKRFIFVNEYLEKKW